MLLLQMLAIWRHYCGLPADAGEVDDHVGDEEAHHPKDAPAGAHQRQAGVLKRCAEEIACAHAASPGYFM